MCWWMKSELKAMLLGLDRIRREEPDVENKNQKTKIKSRSVGPNSLILRCKLSETFQSTPWVIWGNNCVHLTSKLKVKNRKRSTFFWYLTSGFIVSRILQFIDIYCTFSADPNPREPFVSVLLPSAEEVSAQRFVSLSCLVRGFSPREIFVKWTVNDKPVNPGNYRNTEVVAENGNSPFFMYSLLSIAAEEWSSGASYSCVVGHEAIPLKIINRTVDKSSGKPSFVNISLALMDTVNSCQWESLGYIKNFNKKNKTFFL